MSQVIHKERLCPLCHCSQTLTEDLQTCNCACHPLDRNPREQISALQAEIKRLMESGDFQLSERTRLREERDALNRENEALRVKAERYCEATTIAVRTLARNSTPEQKAWSLNKIRELRGEALDAARKEQGKRHAS